MSDRFKVEERTGIIAVYDTSHPGYEDAPGCHADYPWVVASWTGVYNESEGFWSMQQWQRDKAYALCNLLNGKENGGLGVGNLSQSISDGFGGEWSRKCPECCEMSMEIVRPGKVQCGNCG